MSVNCDLSVYRRVLQRQLGRLPLLACYACWHNGCPALSCIFRQTLHQLNRTVSRYVFLTFPLSHCSETESVLSLFFSPLQGRKHDASESVVVRACTRKRGVCMGAHKMIKLRVEWCLICNKKLSYCWETVRRESMPRIAEMDVEMTT